ncbi:MAG TPA: HAD-IA family hydrolase [Candidatus Limnocylindria bacterium]|jgi:2-haloalkanoic acid dehalogenase type II|nr:HAD-IA family hydrolase [Candidatus Limnocylindria bacterium]
MRADTKRVRYAAIGFDLLTALLDTWSLFADVAGGRELGMRWHAASQSLLRGKPYRPFEDVVRDAAGVVGIERRNADELLRRWAESAPWPDVPDVLPHLSSYTRFIVTNCSERLGALAAARAGTFDLVMTAERAGAYKPDPQPYRAALDALVLHRKRVLFVAGSAHDVGGAMRSGMDVYWANRGRVPAPTDAKAIREEEDLRGLLDVLEG